MLARTRRCSTISTAPSQPAVSQRRVRLCSPMQLKRPDSRLAERNRYTDKRVIIEAKGSGVCLLDYDNDGWLDIYLVNGSTLEARAGQCASTPCGTLPQQS